MLVESEPTDIDVIDAKETKKEETSKKPVRKVTVKEETTNEDTVFNLLSTQSVVWAQWKRTCNITQWIVDHALCLVLEEFAIKV